MEKKRLKRLAVPVVMTGLALVLAGCQMSVNLGEPGLTYENFEQVVVGDEITGNGGSTYEEVVELMGSEPNMKDEVDMGENKLVQAQWYEEGEPDSESYMSVNFTEGKASYKGQHGYGE